jgi:hypothetical protein
MAFLGLLFRARILRLGGVCGVTGPVRRRVIARLNVWGGGLTLRKTADKLSSTRAEFDNTSRNILYSQGRAF